ncbi:citrate lyase subunit beta [Sarocladium strictum]
MSRAVLRRSLLYVPGSSPRFLEKSTTSSADCIIYDLEDSVTPANKPSARHLVRTALDKSLPSAKEHGVRINSIPSNLALLDLQTILPSPALTTLVLPKCDTAGDLTFLRDAIAHLRPSSLPPVSVIALIESAKALANLHDICKAAPALLSGLAFAAEDFNADMRITRTPSMTEMLFARSSIVAAARAYNLSSILDLVATSFKDEKQLRQEVQDGKNMGFTGKQCIHPGQVDAVNEAFAPSWREVEWAVRVGIAQKKADEEGRGAWTLDGKMIDRPVVQRAANIVHMAKLCGLDVTDLERKHASQGPE